VVGTEVGLVGGCVAGVGGTGWASEIAAPTTKLMSMIGMRCFVFMSIVISTSMPAPNGVQTPGNQPAKLIEFFENVPEEDNSRPECGQAWQRSPG